MQISISDPTDALKRAPVCLGAVLFVILAPVHILLPQAQSIVVAGVTLALMGSAYVGFAAQADSNHAFGASVPNWYIPFCMTFNLTAAAFVFLLYGAKTL